MAHWKMEKPRIYLDTELVPLEAIWVCKGIATKDGFGPSPRLAFQGWLTRNDLWGRYQAIEAERRWNALSDCDRKRILHQSGGLVRDFMKVMAIVFGAVAIIAWVIIWLSYR